MARLSAVEDQKVLDCPYCGGPAHSVHTTSGSGFCCKCQKTNFRGGFSCVTGPILETETKAINAWNTWVGRVNALQLASQGLDPAEVAVIVARYKEQHG